MAGDGAKKVMTESLRALERDGLQRRIFAEVPVRVEYSLTPLGRTMTEPLVALSDWAPPTQATWQQRGRTTASTARPTSARRSA